MTQGLQISLMGLMITFLALGVFIGIMIVLQRLFPGREEVEDVGESKAVIEITTDQAGEEGAIVAAISVALAYAAEKGQLKGSAQLGSALQEGRGGWWSARRGEADQGMRGGSDAKKH